MTPVVIEVAVNGATSKARNPNVPIAPDEIARDGLACLDAGAAIVHSHPDDFSLTGEAAAARYLDAWRPIVAVRRMRSYTRRSASAARLRSATRTCRRWPRRVRCAWASSIRAP